MIVVVRIFGWSFVAFALVFILLGIIVMLFAPQLPVTINGVKRTDMAAKLFFFIIPLPPLGGGLLLAFIPKSWITTLFIFHVEQMRWVMALFKKPPV
jgi:hypothetical protein